ncbi:ATP-binding protein [Sorangium sp. So ce448]|uniref:AAA family ATPase n=1 Tax=Sorangium sp. So ce448 TaxID=3133314 RepID=UPI003F62FFD7
MPDRTDFLDTISEHFREELATTIARSERGRTRMKLRTFLEGFGYTASARVRQTSLSSALENIQRWGYAHKLSGSTVNDYITIWKSDAPVSSEQPQRAARDGDGSARGVVAWKDGELDLPVDPLTFGFHVDDAPTGERSGALWHDITAAIWLCRTVCLMVDASDEMFTLLAGVLAALTRRRALTFRFDDMGRWVAQAPEVLTLSRLRSVTGQGDRRESDDFPGVGAVYLIRDDPHDVVDDELTAFVREAFIPHTYRVRAIFATTTADPGPDARRAADDSHYPQLLRWLAAYTGAPSVEADWQDGDVEVQLSSLFADAARAADALLDRATYEVTHPKFDAGYEGTEHMVLKAVMLEHLTTRFPNENVLVERVLEIPADVDEPEADVPDMKVARPDLRVVKKLWVEVETLRGIALRGSNPFFFLENKLRRKRAAMLECEQVWLLFPRDVALLARHQVSAIVRNVAGDALDRVRLGFVDLQDRRPIFVRLIGPPRQQVRIRGVAWREARKPIVERPLDWTDVAGYADLKARLQSDLLAPLVEPSRYQSFGVSAPNGLLLYGLPGCGKSLIGRVLAGQASLTCRRLVPSDLTSMWLGEGVEKIREVFTWALKQAPSMLILDEFDGVAPQRSEVNMHTDEKRQVNELLAQLDRLSGRSVVVVATTNYARGIDSAVRRSGRFDLKFPVFPPQEDDRREIFEHYLGGDRMRGIRGIDHIDTHTLAASTRLFTPSDIRCVVEGAVRRAVWRAGDHDAPTLDTGELLARVGEHPRTIQRDDADRWLEEARLELGRADATLEWLEREVRDILS